MWEKSRLEELSLALPEDERKKLLERISKRMEKEESEEAVPVELEQSERETIISYEMKKANWWVRFLIWLRTFFSGRTRLDVFLEIKLQMLKSKIRSVNPGLTGFETRDITPKFARRLHAVYEKLLPLMDPYQALTSDKSVKTAGYMRLVESRFDKARKSVEEFITRDEMEEIFSKTGDTEEIKRRLSLRMNEYIRTTPDSMFARLEEQIQLHLFLGRLAVFPFANVFRYFNYTPTANPEEDSPDFQHAPVMLILDLLEKLYADFVLVGRCSPEYAYAEEPLESYFSTIGAPASEPSGEGKEGNANMPALAKMRGEILELCKEIEKFEDEVPLLDIIRYFRKDPYYNLVFKAPRLHLKSLYFTTLKARVAVELERKLGMIKERVIEHRIQEILKSRTLLDFSNYVENPGFDFRKLGLPSFSYVRSLNLTYNYLVSQYKGFIQEAVQVVANTALASNRITQSRLMQSVSGLEELEAKILLFDRSLSPDEDDGKQLGRFRFNVATDLILQKSYRAFVAQKDRDARDLVEKAKECLMGVKKIFDELRTSTFENTRSLLKTLHIYKGKNQTLGSILNARSEGMGAFLTLLDQLLEVEKGS